MAFTIGEGNIIEVRLEGRCVPTQSRWNTVRHIRCTEAPTDDDLNDYNIMQQLAGLWAYRYNSLLTPVLSDDWVCEIIRCKRIASTQSVFGAVTVAYPGGVTGPVDEPDDAVVISLYTLNYGRSYQGRLYQGGWPDVDVQDGATLDIETQQLADAWATLLLQDFDNGTGGTYENVVFSRKLFDDTSSTAIAAARIYRVTADRIMRRMTSRDLKGRLPVEGVDETP